MIPFNNFIYSPGGENENGTANSSDSQNQKDSSSLPEKDESGNDHKSIVDKIKDALQDWSNKDESDQEDDDTKV